MNVSILSLLFAVLACMSLIQASEDLLSNLLDAGAKDLELLTATAPSLEPTAEPSAEPTATPTLLPSSATPTRKPSALPTLHMPTPAPGQPTAKPTSRPTTSAPTYQTSPIVSFTSNFTLGGASSPVMGASEQLALRNVTAWAMQVTIDTVTFVRNTAVAENRRMLRNGMSLFTTKWKLFATTRLDLPVSAGDTTNTTLLYIQKTTLLNSAVANNQFTQQLNKVALQVDGYGLVGSDVESVENSAATVDNDLQYPPEDDDKGLSDGAIAGIVIGVVVFAALVAMGIYYFVYVRGGPKSHEAFQSNSDVEISL